MVFRTLLLFLSSRKVLRRWMETSRLTARLTERFVAGETLEQALQVCRRLERENSLVTLDRLGENVTSAEEAAASLEGYLEIVGKIAGLSLPASVSIKLTQFGMDISEPTCRANVARLVEAARRHGKWVEIDMESHEYVDRTLALVREMHASYPNVRSVIQAYLHRSEKDVDRLCDEGIPVRLCKGAYREPPAVAFQKKSEVDSSYVRLMRILLARGTYPGIATHDPAMIEATRRFARDRNIGPERFEFQMLYGVRRDLGKRLIADGFRVRLYVPFGEAWYPYFMRRLAERPANLTFLLRNLLKG